MIIETQNTNDENVLNFFPPKAILNLDTTEFVDAKSIRKSPLAETIFDLGDITSVLITSDMLSITKEQNASWEDLKPQVLSEIMDFITTGQEAHTPCTEKTDSDIINQVQSLINARIRPAIQQDGGDIVLKKFENGIVYVELKGNCVGCPYALVTLKEGVEKILKAYIPEVKSVQNFEEDN